MMSERTPDPSEQQRLAADPAVSAWVDASAGSGKTKVLTDRVLALLLDGAAPHRILCLTFTKAAAGEMANRITARLSSWARLPEQDLIADLRALPRSRHPDGHTIGGGGQADGDGIGAPLIGRARRLFARVQEAPGGVRIDTMHAFCQGVLQRFPVEAGVPPHFDVLDERDQRALLTQARDSLVLSIADEPDSPLAEDWARMLNRLSEHSFAKVMEEITKHRSRLRTARAEDVAAALGITSSLTPAQARAAACAEDAFDRAALQAAIQPLLGEPKTIARFGEAFAKWLSASPAERDFDAYSSELLTAAKAPRSFGKNKLLQTDLRLRQTLEDEQARIVAAHQTIAKAEALADTRALLSVAKELLKRYRAAKEARSRLDYDDLIEGASRLLIDPGAAWVHFKLDGGIDHVLVDEAQDTSPTQWQAISALIAEFFASDSAAAGARHRTFFAVGDPKQSIYGFQGADPAEFGRQRRQISGNATASGQEWRDVPLNVSFRSVPEVLRFVDAVLPEAAAMGLAPATVTHHAHRNHHAGRIEVWPLMEEDEAAGKGDIWDVPREYDVTLSAEERLARTVARKIKDLIDSRELLDATKGKPIRPGDIMVLVRRRRRFGVALVNALKRHGVPVAGLDRMALARQLVVQDLSAFGRFLLTPSDDLTLAAVLKGPFFAWSEERLFRLAHGRQGTLWAALGQCATPENQQDAARLRRWLASAPGMTPFALYSRLLIGDKGREAVLRHIGFEAEDPMNEFLALALSFPQHGPPTLQHFLHWLSADESEIKRELDQGTRDEVRLLTVHAAKGLQAPIVFLPDTAFAPQGYKDSLTWAGETPIWAAGNQGNRDPASQGYRDQAERLSGQEEARLLYVALTRAEDRLYIAGWKPGRSTNKGQTWYERIQTACAKLVSDGEMQPYTFALEGLEGEGFVMGAPPAAAESTADGAAEPAVGLPYWAFEPAPKEENPTPPLAPSRPSPPPPAARSPLRDRAAETQRFRRGTLLHRLFQFLPGTPPDARADAVASILADADLTAEELAAYAAAAAKVLDDPVFAAVFGPAALAEAPLTGLLDGQAVSGVVDRLLITPERVLVIDYKTNRLPPAGPEGIPPAYRRQMQTYARLLAGVYPDRRIETALLWTEAPRLDIVPPPQPVN